MRDGLCVICLVALMAAIGCGATTGYDRGNGEPSPDKAPVEFAPYSGPKVRVAVLPLSLSPEATRAYPEYTQALRDKGVGINLWHYLDASLEKTKRFEFEQIPEGAAEIILEQQWFGQSDLVEPSTALQLGRIKLARYFVYGAVVNFQPETMKRALSGSGHTRYHITIALRFVDGETLDYLPAIGEGAGASVGEACARACDRAVVSLSKDLDRFIKTD